MNKKNTDNIELHEILRKIPIFKGLDENILRSLEVLMEKEKHSKDSMIIEEGEPGESMFILLSGKVRVTKNASGGQQVLITVFEGGTYFGELALIDHRPRSANVIADTEVIVMRLRKHVFDQMLEKNREFAALFYKNCLEETIVRIRETANNLTVSQNVLSQKSNRLEEIDADLSNAKAIQDYFISKDKLSEERLLAKGIRQSFIYRPYLEVGGDFINVIEPNDHSYGIIIADVMGHGISAAMATGVLRGAFTIFSKDSALIPTRLMEKMNRHFYEIFRSMFATCYYAFIDIGIGEARMTKAGHMDPLIWKNDERDLLRLNSPGLGLGIMPDVNYKEIKVRVNSGDKILFFTDGMPEQKNEAGEMYTQERMEALFKKLCLQREKHIVNRLFDDLEAFRGNCAYQDDVTLMLLEF
jgi:serine phosphatase RsbU (regulator of sigma subunit)